MTKSRLSLIFSFLFLLVALSVLHYHKTHLPDTDRPEGKLTIAQMEVGPFDLHRRYRSMEGPYVSKSLTFRQLVETGRTEIGEKEIEFVEGGTQASMQGAVCETTPATGAGNQTRALYWVKRIKLEVLDENDEPLPDCEFICHLNVDADPARRAALFPEAEPCSNSRVFTLTQGQTDITFPQGFGIPVASDEAWNFTFQAANRTTDQHRRIKHLCTLELIKDSDLIYPIRPLTWFNPYIRVVVDRDTQEARMAEHKGMPSCLGTLSGVSAPNATPDSVFTDEFGRRVTGHWVVPPGRHTYNCALNEKWDAGLAQQPRRIHLIWSHVHPLCTECSLVRCVDQKPIFTARCQTSTRPGLQLTHIDTISSVEGIELTPGQPYELVAKYNNTTGEPQDSMVALGIFCADEKFIRPNWVFGIQNEEVFCGVKSQTPVSNLPLFDPKRDGPILKQPVRLEVNTTAGPLVFILDPAWAPKHATQLARMLLGGVYDGTIFYRLEPGFVLQLALAEDKLPGRTISDSARAMIRRLPLEVEPQKAGPLRHQTGYLSMARGDDPESAETSFSIMLGSAPHLDSEYTIFGRLADDAKTQATLKAITSDWAPGRFAITSVRKL